MTNAATWSSAVHVSANATHCQSSRSLHGGRKSAAARPNFGGSTVAFGKQLASAPGAGSGGSRGRSLNFHPVLLGVALELGAEVALKGANGGAEPALEVAG